MRQEDFLAKEAPATEQPNLFEDMMGAPSTAPSSGGGDAWGFDAAPAAVAPAPAASAPAADAWGFDSAPVVAATPSTSAQAGFTADFGGMSLNEPPAAPAPPKDGIESIMAL